MIKANNGGAILRAAIYIRVSTEEQHLNGLSLPAQRLALEEYAEKNGFSVVEYMQTREFLPEKACPTGRDC